MKVYRGLNSSRGVKVKPTERAPCGDGCQLSAAKKMTLKNFGASTQNVKDKKRRSQNTNEWVYQIQNAKKRGSITSPMKLVLYRK